MARSGGKGNNVARVVHALEQAVTAVGLPVTSSAVA